MALDFLAGCAGGVAGVLVGHPFDTVKVRLQVQSMEKPQYRGTLHCFQSIVKQESVLGLYKGLGSPLTGLTFINALVFGVQGNTLRALGHDSPLNQFLAGAAAGAIQCVICCPMELAKTRLQLQDASPTRTYRGSLDCLAQIYRHEGLRGVNRGMVSTLLRETPSFGVYFLTYDVLTRALWKWTKRVNSMPPTPHVKPRQSSSLNLLPGSAYPLAPEERLGSLLRDAAVLRACAHTGDLSMA
ncbi:mitochondrial basic amino acids transporter [Pteropus vampyrus]|uniref:Mitochondrial basic amino acids transporter n=1 Tax=Pteropus vampyrus TaxID=132908 RepID=A0A6P3R0P2_PTEVA|nr:mitochondrial basic amino acids transporter [Pteropus vampyrus]